MIGVQLELARSPWVEVNKNHRGARDLADRHYSRQTPGADGFLPPGRTLALITPCGRAVWGVCENLDPAGVVRFRVTIFRNEGAGLSSRVRSKRDPGWCFLCAGWRLVGKTAGGHGRRPLLVLEAP